MTIVSDGALDRDGGAFVESCGRTCGAQRTSARYKHSAWHQLHRRRRGAIFTIASRPLTLISEQTKRKGSVLRDQLIPGRRVLLIDRVERKLQAIRRAEFVENAEEIVSNRVFAQIQLARNITVRAPLRNQIDQALFARREQRGALRIRDRRRGWRLC